MRTSFILQVLKQFSYSELPMERSLHIPHLCLQFPFPWERLAQQRDWHERGASLALGKAFSLLIQLGLFVKGFELHRVPLGVSWQGKRTIVRIR